MIWCILWAVKATSLAVTVVYILLHSEVFSCFLPIQGNSIALVLCHLYALPSLIYCTTWSALKYMHAVNTEGSFVMKSHIPLLFRCFRRQITKTTTDTTRSTSTQPETAPITPYREVTAARYWHKYNRFHTVIFTHLLNWKTTHPRGCVGCAASSITRSVTH